MIHTHLISIISWERNNICNLFQNGSEYTIIIIIAIIIINFIIIINIIIINIL